MKRRVTLTILVILAVFVFFGLISTLSLKKAYTSSQKAIGAAKLQDLVATKAYLKDAKRDFKAAKTSLIVFTPVRIIPLIGWYVADLQRGVDTAIYGLEAASVFAEAVTPYADVLGLSGEGTFLGGTAQERMAKAIETLSKVTPQLDQVAESLSKAQKQLAKIDTWRYPNILPGKPGAKIKNAQNTLSELETFLTDTKPLLVVLPQIMGQEQEKKYLILFQNDKELRPTGGFITAYAIFKVQNGLVTPEKSSDIYNLDDSLTKHVPAPEPIIKYLSGVSTLNLRDSNLSPDYYLSMKQFEDLYQYAQEEVDIDGIIALDTNFVLKMIEVLGPVEAYGSKFTTEEVEVCACPQIIYELELYADQPVNYEKGSRKDIIGVLMKQMMDMAFNAPKSAWPNLLGATAGSLRQKHLLLYFKDPKIQEAAERINFAGRLNQYDGDYLHINETNFGGAKSNLYIEEEVKQEVKRGKDGKLEKKLEISYKYPREGDNCNLERKSGLCLAGIYRDWIRIYVPKGAELVKSSGTEVAITAKEELGKTLFEGFFTIRPTGTAKIEIEYTVPVKADGEYKLLIQKQPGAPGHEYEIEAFGKKQKAFPLDTDKELIVKI